MLRGDVERDDGDTGGRGRWHGRERSDGAYARRVPVTVAHPAVVLPLRGLLARVGLPLTPVVVGAMAPDLGLFLRRPGLYDLAHGPVGVALWVPLLTTLVVAAWFGLVRDALVGSAPLAVRSRLAPHVRLAPRAWAWVPVGGAVGAATHTVWDAFTHPGRWGWESVAWLSAQQGPLPGGKWVQYVTGVLGMVVVLVAAVRWLASQRVLAEAAPRVVPWPLLESVVLGAALVGGATAARRLPEGLHSVAFGSVVNALVALVVGALLATVVWHSARLAARGG